jgi:hypothetical protein
MLFVPIHPSFTSAENVLLVKYRGAFSNVITLPPFFVRKIINICEEMLLFYIALFVTDFPNSFCHSLIFLFFVILYCGNICNSDAAILRNQERIYFFVFQFN